MMQSKRSNVWLAMGLFFCGLQASCSHRFIAGTQVRDTEENRQIFAVLTQARQALQERDATTLLAMVSSKYFEDNGTADPHDDYGYTELAEKILKESMDTAKEVYVNFDVHEIVVKGAYAYADIRYTARTRLELPAGRLWDTHNDFDRIELVREDDKIWRIISGL